MCGGKYDCLTAQRAFTFRSLQEKTWSSWQPESKWVAGGRAQVSARMVILGCSSKCLVAVGGSRLVDAVLGSTCLKDPTRTSQAVIKDWTRSLDCGWLELCKTRRTLLPHFFTNLKLFGRSTNLQCCFKDIFKSYLIIRVILNWSSCFPFSLKIDCFGLLEHVSVRNSLHFGGEGGVWCP